ncbi:hypothetical protein GBA52_028510 [Prunus armeniaca]|nr:hypothetical protein GBA52_028510 [Prunus armeniaca]
MKREREQSPIYKPKNAIDFSCMESQNFCNSWSFISNQLCCLDRPSVTCLLAILPLPPPPSPSPLPLPYLLPPLSVEADLGLVTAKGDKTSFHGSDRSGSIHDHDDLVHAVTSFGVHRKKRMTRQRRSSIINLHHLTFASSTTTTSHVLPSLQSPSTLPPARVIDPTRLRFLFQKELKNSDVSSLRRMILPKVIQAKKASDQDHVYGDISTMNNGVNDLFLDESEANKSSSFYMPTMAMDEDTTAGMSFVYDTTTFSNDSLLDFLGIDDQLFQKWASA